MVTWQVITEPYLHGWFACIGEKSVEVVRSYAGDWRVYHFLSASRPLRAERESNPISYRTWQQARAAGRRWLEAV